MNQSQLPQHNDIEKGPRTLHHDRPLGATNGVNEPVLDQAPPPFARRGKPTRLGNPGPLGLCSFASTTFLLSLINLQTRGVGEPNVVVGMALFVGGLVQLLAGMWEFAVGNTFGATAFSSYGGFWLSYAAILIPGSGILASYSTPAAEGDLHNALAMFLTAWFIFTFLMLLGALRRNASLIALFFCLTITFLLLAIGEYNENVTITKAGGGFGVVTAFIAWYTAMGELLRPDDAWFTVPLGHIPKRVD